MLAGVMPWAANRFLIEVLAVRIMKAQMQRLKGREMQGTTIKNWQTRLLHIEDLDVIKQLI